MSNTNLNAFDKVSGVYDSLVSLVFGQSIRNAQLIYLGEVKHSKCILIIGGGTGWIIEELIAINANAAIWYVEASGKMLKISKSRDKVATRTNIKFVHGTEKSLPDFPVFDAVIANFYFDLFSDDALESVIACLRRSMFPGTILLVSDFNPPVNWWQRLLMSSMYRFFRIVSGLVTDRLPHWQRSLKKNNFLLLKTGTFYRGFIRSSVCQFVNFSVLFS
ncbi:MAG: methyltransferase domain-containing protein [Chryseolinea sp.]